MKIARAILADSVIPKIVRAGKIINTTAVVSMGGMKGTKFFRYSAAVLAEITAVVRLR